MFSPHCVLEIFFVQHYLLRDQAIELVYSGSTSLGGGEERHFSRWVEGGQVFECFEYQWFGQLYLLPVAGKADQTFGLQNTQTLARYVVRIHPGVIFLSMMQASLATCCEFATGLYIVGCGICAV